MRTSTKMVFVLSIFCASGLAQAPGSQDQSLTGPVQSFDPSHQKPISYTVKSLRVSLVLGTQRHSLTIANLTTKTEKSVGLPEEMAQVDEIRMAMGAKVVVRGMVNGSGSEIAVIDIASGSLIDKFICYSPSVSPDGHYIALVKYYPPHFSEGTEDHYLLYDLSRKPADNRPAGVTRDDWMNVGRVVYPVGQGNAPGDNNARPENTRHESKSLFFWNPLKSQFLFADRISQASEITLVLVDIDSSGTAIVRTNQQAIDQLCSTLNDPRKTRSCPLLVRKVEFHSPAEPAFTITLEIVDVHRVKSFELNSSQFGPAT